MNKTKIDVFLVDDHPIVEAGIRLGFNLTEDFHLMGTALSHDRALHKVTTLQPDIVILDLVINGVLELDYINLYRKALPGARIVAFSSLESTTFAEKCLAAGADGFVSKSTSPHELVTALREILNQDNPRIDSPLPVNQLNSIVLDGIKLTARETEVAQQLAHGYAIQKIADTLGISKKTAAIHRDNLRQKLNCNTSSELIAILASSRSSAAEK